MASSGRGWYAGIVKLGLAILGLAILLLVPEFIWGPGATDSGRLNEVWTLGMAHGGLYPRWLDTSFEGLGAPTFFFYPPIFFWLSGKLHALGADLDLAVDLANLVFLGLSGATMADWLRAKGASPWWALAYMALPYHLADLYGRGALAEGAAYIWLPLIALAIERLPRRGAIVGLAVSYAGLILTHLPMALLASLFLVGPMVVARTTKDRAVVFAGAAGAALGLALAGAYLVPALGLLGYINDQVLTGDFYKPMNWGVLGHVQRGEWDVLMGRPLLSVAMALAVMSLGGARFWRWLTLGCAVLALGLIPIWFGPLERVQFPWRLLEIVDFTAVTALATAERRRFLPLAASLVLMTPFALTETFHALRAFDGASPPWRALIAAGEDAAEYTPKGFALQRVTAGTLYADVSPYAGLPLAADTVTVQALGRVVVRRFYFPIWRVSGPHGEVATAPDGPGRLLSFQAEPGVYRISRAAHPLERKGWFLSGLGLLALFAVIIAPVRWRPEPKRPLQPHAAE